MAEHLPVRLELQGLLHGNNSCPPERMGEDMLTLSTCQSFLPAEMLSSRIATIYPNDGNRTAFISFTPYINTTMSKFNFALHHVSLLVSDTRKALDFYHDILDLPLANRPDMGFPGAWLQVGGQQIHLLELENPDPTTGRPAHGGRDRHFAMTADCIDAIREHLDQAGITYSLSKSGRKALFCRDPDGNAVEIIQRGHEPQAAES